jgi:hypothetical protein
MVDIGLCWAFDSTIEIGVALFCSDRILGLTCGGQFPTIDEGGVFYL